MKFLSILFILLGISNISFAQSMVIHYSDGEKSSIKTEEIDSITISKDSHSEIKKSLADSLFSLNSKIGELENNPIELSHGRYYNLNTKNSVSSSNNIQIEDDSNETMFSGSALKVTLKNIDEKVNTNHSNSYRGYIDFKMPTTETINKSKQMIELELLPRCLVQL